MIIDKTSINFAAALEALLRAAFVFGIAVGVGSATFLAAVVMLATGIGIIEW